MVIAETSAAARDGAERVGVDWVPLPAVTASIAAAAPDAPILYEGTTSNVCVDCEVGDAAAVDTAFSRAAHVVRLDTWVQRVTGVTMEPRAAVGVWDPASGRYTVHAGAGGLGRTQTGVAGALGVPESAVRVTARDVGGNFGTRNSCYPGVRAGRLGGAAPRPAREVDGRAARGDSSPTTRAATSRCTPSWRSTPTAPSSRFGAPTPATSAPTPSRSTRSTRAWRSRPRSTACRPWRYMGAPSSRTRRRPRRTAARGAPRSCSSWSG